MPVHVRMALFYILSVPDHLLQLLYLLRMLQAHLQVLLRQNRSERLLLLHLSLLQGLLLFQEVQMRFRSVCCLPVQQRHILPYILLITSYSPLFLIFLDNVFLFEFTDQVCYGFCWIKIYFLTSSFCYFIRCFCNLCWLSF